MYRNLININSNIYSKLNIDKARRMLAFTFPDIEFTRSIISVPASEEEGEGIFPFRNILGQFYSDEPYEEVTKKIKSIEYALNKTAKGRGPGRVIISIDLLQHGENLLREQDLESEHVQELLKDFSEEEH